MTQLQQINHGQTNDVVATNNNKHNDSIITTQHYRMMDLNHQKITVDRQLMMYINHQKNFTKLLRLHRQHTEIGLILSLNESLGVSVNKFNLSIYYYQA